MNLRMRSAYFTAWLMFCHAYIGAGYAFGSERLTSAPVYQYLLDLAPGRAWGWSLLVGAALTGLAPHFNRWISAACHALASVPYLAFATALALGDLNAVTHGWGGPALWATPVVLGHAVLVITRFRHARDGGKGIHDAD